MGADIVQSEKAEGKSLWLYTSPWECQEKFPAFTVMDVGVSDSSLQFRVMRQELHGTVVASTL